MRLFIAINFEKSVREKIQEISDELKKYSSQGRFVSQDNLHLTLEFLGEISEKRIVAIQKVMDKLNFKPFDFRLSKIGYFKRPQGNIYWLGIEDNEVLMNLQRTIHKLLGEEGFKLEDRPYKPHITLGRKVKLKGSFNYSSLDDRIKDIVISVDKIDLMKSETIKGKLIYSTLYSKNV